MKTRLALIVIALLAVCTYASTTWKANESTPVAPESTLLDDDALTVKTVYATTLNGNSITIAGEEFTHYIQVRNAELPTEASPDGTENSGSTSLVVTAKKDVTLTVYYRRQPREDAYISNDGKDLKLFNRADLSLLDGTLTLDSKTEDEKYGFVTKVYEFGGGQVREHLGGIYDFLRSRKIEDLNQLGAVSPRREEHVARSENNAVTQRTEPEGNLAPQNEAISNKLSYLDRKEQQRKVKRTEKAVKECEERIMKLEARQKELDDILCTPEGACDMKVVSEYTELKKTIDQETERWEQLAEELETLQAQLL